jgi:hypothetical protein
LRFLHDKKSNLDQVVAVRITGMTGTSPNQMVCPNDVRTRPAAAAGVRTDIDSMLMPFFPEHNGLKEFSTEINGYQVSMHTEDGSPIATAVDKKILNLLAKQIDHQIRSGFIPSREMEVDIKDFIDVLSNDGAIGGSEYQRINERLNRLKATTITTERMTGEASSTRRIFSWIDSVEQDIQHTPRGKKIVRLKIALSDDAFKWITGNEGFDITREDFHALTSMRSSVWRIYEICLAHLLRSDGRPTRMSLDDLRLRVPINSELKVFKARTLKSAMKAIEEHEQMSKVLKLGLERQTHTGFVPTDFAAKRVSLNSLYVGIRAGEGPLPRLNRLIPSQAPQPTGLPLFDASIPKEGVM